MDVVCKRYGQRPSSLAAIDDGLTAYDFDCAIAWRGMKHENDAYKKRREGGDGSDRLPGAVMARVKKMQSEKAAPPGGMEFSLN